MMLIIPVAPVDVKWDIFSFQVDVFLKHPQESLARTPQDHLEEEEELSEEAYFKTLVCIYAPVPKRFLSSFLE